MLSLKLLDHIDMQLSKRFPSFKIIVPIFFLFVSFDPDTKYMHTFANGFLLHTIITTLKNVSKDIIWARKLILI